ncbi:hypothetical protein [Chryseobacterium paridis]|uniref:Quinol oxidase subunit 4 n=1 Tax=Chryseobacterium paridis TaxID=2800328 RepID=A0ABS1FYF5_9FLAO|nr:hypothetical protein [Chryseobacterium paridis]MBK1897491.1 hypothetical protein [Chryseobacterium paridis]
MKTLFLICLFLVISCNNNKNNSSSQKYDESRELVPNPEGYQKDTFPSDTMHHSSANKDSIKTKNKNIK